MQIGKLHVDNRIAAGIAVAALFVGGLLWPGSRPQDEVLKLHVDPTYNAIQRTFLTSKTRKPRNPWGRSGLLAYNPRSISLKSDGPAFDAYVLDLADFDEAGSVDHFLDASRRLDAGEQLAESATVSRKLGVTETTFSLATIPFGARANYMVIVYGEEPTEVTGIVSYGRAAAK